MQPSLCFSVQTRGQCPDVTTSFHDAPRAKSGPITKPKQQTQNSKLRGNRQPEPNGPFLPGQATGGLRFSGLPREKTVTVIRDLDTAPHSCSSYVEWHLYGQAPQVS